jgi:hypothetical protein
MKKLRKKKKKFEKKNKFGQKIMENEKSGKFFHGFYAN